MAKNGPLGVEMPASDGDKPGWIKVGAIAVIGFVVGVAWPRVLGVRLGPAPPGSSTASTSASAQPAGRAPDGPAASVVASSPAAPASVTASAPVVRAPAAASAVLPSVAFNRGTILSCRTADGETKKSTDCGPLQALDTLVLPRLRKLATCAGLEGQAGKLSVVVTADFEARRISHTLGKSTSLSNVQAVEGCLESALGGLSTSGVAHTHPRYTVAYIASVGAPSGNAPGPTDARSARERTAKRGPDEAEAKPALASGEAQIAWDVALVREAPKTGAVIGRLPRGSRVKLGTEKEGWYLVKFGEGFGREGWLYRGAIGR